jgi:death on curing protein
MRISHGWWQDSSTATDPHWSGSLNVRYLTVEQVLFIHDRLIEVFGGSHGVRDLNALESAVGRPASGFGDSQVYPDLFSKAAALLISLIGNHPFVDGNKRTGITAAGLFLEMNQLLLNVPERELDNFAVYVATQKPAVEDVAAWFRANCEPLSGAENSQ